jgi:hypothetical protein
MAHLQEGCPNYIQKGNLCAIPLKKVKFKVKNKEATVLSQNIVRLYPTIPPTAHLNLVSLFL